MDKKRDLSIYRMQNAKDTLDTAKIWMLCIKNSTWKSFSGNEKKDESASGIKRNTISRPTAYGEYAPYTFIENEEEFEKLVEKMK